MERHRFMHNRVSRRIDERGAVLLFTSIVLPVLVLFAGLGIGAASARAADDETQRTANLAAAAQAANIPNVGRPSIACGSDPTCVEDLPNAPDYPEMLPPSIELPDDAVLESTSTPSMETPGTTVESTSTPSTDVDGTTIPPFSTPSTAVDSVTVPSTATPSTTLVIGDTTDVALQGPYAALQACADAIDRSISEDLDTAPVSPCGLIDEWTEGCVVAAAQYSVANRARYSQIFGSGPTPRCTTHGQDSRVYLRPEMESTGAYRLQRCLASSGRCVDTLGVNTQEVLTGVGQQYAAQTAARTGRVEGIVCLIAPARTGCPLQDDLDFAGMAGNRWEKVRDATNDSLASSTGVPHETWEAVQSDVADIVGSAFGLASPASACGIVMGNTGQQLCDSGVNLASLLPSTLVPRIRAQVNHYLDAPLVPGWVNGDEAGDFSFTAEALARRAFKTAVVLPTLPGSMTPLTDTCYLGKNTLGSILTPLAGVTQDINQLATAARAAGTATTIAGNRCKAANVDRALADPTACQNPDTPPAARSLACRFDVDLTGIATPDLNNEVRSREPALVDAAARMNTLTSRAVNRYMANRLNVIDPPGPGEDRDPVADCEQKSPPEQWCVDVAGQQIRDLQDLMDNPSGGQAPGVAELLEAAFNEQQPITVIGLGKTIDLCQEIVALCGLNGALTTALRNTPGLDFNGVVEKLPLVVPALDAVPVWVRQFDKNNPSATVLEVIDDTTEARGLYRAVLLDPEAAVFPLCPTGATGDGCNDLGHTVTLPTVTTTLPATTIPPVVSTLLPSVTTTSIDIPSTSTTSLPPIEPIVTTIVGLVPTTPPQDPSSTTTTLLPGIGF